MSHLSEVLALEHAATSVTRKPAFGSLSSHTGSYAGQTVWTEHPYRVCGIFLPSPGLDFPFWAVAEAPRLPEETGKEKGQVLESPLPLTSSSFLGLLLRHPKLTPSFSPSCYPLLWWWWGREGRYGG